MRMSLSAILLSCCVLGLGAQERVLELGQLSDADKVPGRTFDIRVTGDDRGGVWGTDIYTADSHIPAAAVHAGVLRPGETRVVRIQFLAGQNRYLGSVRNGVRSSDWAAYPLSFQFLPLEANLPPQRPVTAKGNRLIVLGEVFRLNDFPLPVGASCVMRVTGATDGRVWGSGVYTSDSDVPTAAVHAGLLRPGEVGLIQMVIEAGQPRYRGSVQNGVNSLDYGSWNLSYRLRKVQHEGEILEARLGSVPVERFPEALPGRSFVVLVVGQTTGVVWGTEIYTADSDLGAAAVHAGLLSVGQTGYVRVRVLPGQQSYRGSLANGIQSRDWRNYTLSFSLEPVEGAQ